MRRLRNNIKMQLDLDVLVLGPMDRSFGKDNEISHKTRRIAGLLRNFLASCESKKKLLHSFITDNAVYHYTDTFII
jgi:hypothetical protein